MPSEVQIILKKKEYNSSSDSGDGIIVFDNNTQQIFVGGECFSSNVKNAAYNTATKTLTLTKADSTTISINLSDATSASQPNSVLSGIRDDINSNTSALSVLNGSGQGSVSQAVADGISGLDSNVTIAQKSNDIVTIKTDVTETDGMLSNSSSGTITLAKVASTGSSSDVSVSYNSESTNLQTTITDIDSRLDSLSSNQLQYIIPTSNATTPSGYSHYYSGSSAYTGSLEASADTMNQIYVCRTTNGGDYHQIMTVKNSDGTAYSWVDLSTETIDLSGYVKSITVNGMTYTTTESGTDITLADVVTAVTGETALNNGNEDYVSVTVEPSVVSGGNKSVSLVSKVKIQPIETSSSSSDGIASAYDVKEYVNSNLTTIRTWTEADIVSSLNLSAEL